VAAIVLLTLGQCFLWLAAASITWSFRALLAQSPALVEERTRIALAEYAWLGLNVAALLGFIARRRLLVAWLLGGVLSLDLAATVILGLGAHEWWLGSVDAAAILFLLSLLFRASAHQGAA
jgi:hypothetical protein